MLYGLSFVGIQNANIPARLVERFDQGRNYIITY